MSDSAAVIETNNNAPAIEAEIQSWLDNNTVTSVDMFDTVEIGRDRTAIVIVYTA